MLSTKHIVTDVKQVPINWIFEYYLQLPEKLHGQSVKISSVFKTERTPSMVVFYDKNVSEYRFKDFSTGLGGSAYELIVRMFDVSFAHALQKILSDYSAAKVQGYTPVDVNPESSFKIESYEIRNWIQNDATYWKQFGISRKQLEKYNVKPLKSYTMSNGSKTHYFEPKILCYGYFNLTDNIYKIYSPKSPKRKFFKVAEHVQGIEQLQYKSDVLVICSSLKDAMCLDSMGFSLEVIAPDSENTLIKAHYMDYFRYKYKKIITLFDNDEAGIKAIERYRQEFGINGCFYPTAKDISDAVARDGIEIVKNTLNKILTSAILL